MIVQYNNGKIAKNIADLLNKYGDMSYPFKFDANLILNSTVKYIPIFVVNKVVACVGLRKNINKTEICHLVVEPEFRRKGLATLLYKWAIHLADTKSLFCYIRTNNIGSIRAAEKNGFKKKFERSYKGRRLGYYTLGVGNENKNNR